MRTMKITDLELMQRCRSGDDDAFSALMARYERQVKTSLSRSIGGLHDVAEDLAQRTFIRLHERVTRGELVAGEDGSIERFVFAIAGALAVDHLRHEHAQARSAMRWRAWRPTTRRRPTPSTRRRRPSASCMIRSRGSPPRIAPR